MGDPLAQPEAMIRRVYAYVAYRIGDGPDAEDVTSEVFVRALRYRGSYDPAKGQPITWLTGIARTVLIENGRAPQTLGEDALPALVEPSQVEERTAERLALADALARSLRAGSRAAGAALRRRPQGQTDRRFGRHGHACRRGRPEPRPGHGSGRSSATTCEVLRPAGVSVFGSLCFGARGEVDRMFGRWRGDRLERSLRDQRPTPSDEFMARMSSEISRRPVRRGVARPVLALGLIDRHAGGVRWAGRYRLRLIGALRREESRRADEQQGRPGQRGGGELVSEPQVQGDSCRLNT